MDEGLARVRAPLTVKLMLLHLFSRAFSPTLTRDKESRQVGRRGREDWIRGAVVHNNLLITRVKPSPSPPLSWLAAGQRANLHYHPSSLGPTPRNGFICGSRNLHIFLFFCVHKFFPAAEKALSALSQEIKRRGPTGFVSTYL